MKEAYAEVLEGAGDIQYPTGKKQKFTKDKSDPKVAAGRKAAKEMGLLRKEELEASGLFTAEELEQIQEVLLGKKLSPEAKAKKDREKKLRNSSVVLSTFLILSLMLIPPSVLM